ncbi:MAG: putative ABC-type ATPase [Planctomycetota bacterium]|jgi:predicted ABC-type ATPase
MGPGQEHTSQPEIIVVGGPNGAGKTTTAARVVPYGLHEGQFLNADFMAKAISPHDPAGAAMKAGRMMLARMRECREARESFSFESTLASRGFARFLMQAKADGYIVRMGYVSVQVPELSVLRVAQRVSRGGHDIPEDVIRRRYWRSLVNFERLYRPLCDAWTLYDNGTERLFPVASQRYDQTVKVHDSAHWKQFNVLGARALSL